MDIVELLVLLDSRKGVIYVVYIALIFLTCSFFLLFHFCMRKCSYSKIKDIAKSRHEKKVLHPYNRISLFSAD